MGPRAPSLRSWRLGAAVLGLASAAHGQGKEGPFFTSGNSTYTVRMVEPEPGKCRLEVRRERELRWQLERCIGTVDDVYLVSADGERVWMLNTLPREKAGRRPGTRGPGDPLGQVVVAAEYDSKGTQRAVRTLKQLQPLAEREKVQVLGAHFKWLEGVLGIPGRRPRATEDNEVEFETVGPFKVHLKF